MNTLALTIDSKILVSGSSENTIKLWNFETFDCMKTIYIEYPVKSLDMKTNILVCTTGKSVNIMKVMFEE